MSPQLRVDPPLRDVGGDHCLVAGYDGHPASQEALLTAAGLARQLHARLVVVHVLDVEDYPADPDAADWDDCAERKLSQQRREVERTLVDSDIAWSYHLARGDPAFALAAAARDLDAAFIVVGASGRGIPQRLLHGSVPQALFRHQAKPVLVVPARHR